MSSVGRKKSTPKAAQAAPSSTSSRKRRSKHQNGGVSNRTVSLSEAELRLSNNTHHGGVDTSNEINPASKQNDKNDYGLDPSFNNLSNNYNATHDYNNYKVSKSPNDNYEENFSGSPALALPTRTPLQNTEQVLLPSPIRGNGNNNSKDIGSSAASIKSILSPPFRRKASLRQSLGAPQQSKHHTSDSTDNKKFPGQVWIGGGDSTNRVQNNGSSNYVTKLMFANKNVLKIIPTLRQKAKEGYHLCAQAVKQFDKLESRNLEHAIANESAPEIKKEFRECSLEYTDLLGSIANCGQDLPDDLEKSAIGIMLLFGIKSSIDFINPLFPPDKMDPNNCCLKWVGGHMVYSALLQAGTDPSVLTPQMARDFLDQNSTLFDAYGACCTGNDIDPNHADKDVRKKADPKGNKVETMEKQLEKIAGGELCGLTGSDRMKFWEFFALLFIAWRGQYYYVKSGGKQYTLVVTSFTAANFCQDNPNRNVLENKQIQILTLTHSQVQMYMMPNRKNYPPPVVVKLDRHLQILLDKLDGKLLPDGETEVVASGVATYFQQRAKLLTRDGNAIDDPTTEAWKVFHEDESKLTPEQRALLEEDYIFRMSMARRLIPECEIINLPIQDGTIGITFDKPLDSFVCTVTIVHVDPSPFQVGDIILSLNDTLLFDKNVSQITQLFSNINRSVIIIRSPELVQNQIKVDESLQCLIQVKALLSEVNQQSLPSIQQFVTKAEAIFASGLGSPDRENGSKYGYTNDQLASTVRSHRWIAFLESVDDPLKSLIKEAKRKFHRPISEEAAELLSSCDSIPEELELITANNTTGYKGVTTKSTVSGTRYYASYYSNGKARNLGTFDTVEEAARAYARAHYNFQSKRSSTTKDKKTRGKKRKQIESNTEGGVYVRSSDHVLVGGSVDNTPGIINHNLPKQKVPLNEMSTKQCTLCLKNKKKWSFTAGEWDKVGERQCQVCTKAAAKETAQASGSSASTTTSNTQLLAPVAQQNKNVNVKQKLVMKK